MQYIADNKYTVWPLYRTLVYPATGRPIPPKTVVLTFHDAYSSVYNEAFLILKSRGWPFTVFVTTKYIGEGYDHFMSWEQLREIQLFGGNVGNHSLSHAHLVRQYPTENESQWRQRIINEIAQAQYILQQQLGHPVWAVAYPYGEYTGKVKAILRDMGYFGLGQQSGTINYSSDFQALPRFPMATGFDSIEDFAIKIATRPFPVNILSPVDGVISNNTDIPVLTMQLKEGDYKKETFACYTLGQGIGESHR